MPGDDLKPAGACRELLNQFRKPLAGDANASVANADLSMREMAAAYAPGRVSHLGGDIPTLAPHLVGPTRTQQSFQPIALNPEGVRGDEMTIVPAESVRLFGPDPYITEVGGDQQGDSDQEDHEADTPMGGPNTEPEAAPSAVPYGHLGAILAAPFTDCLKPLEIGDRTSLAESMASNGGISKLHEIQEAVTIRKPKKSRKPGKRPHAHLDYAEPPLSNIYEIFNRITGKALDLQDENGAEGDVAPFLAGCKMLQKSPLRIFTMCSGTEAPILAMDLVKQSLQQQDVSFNFEHVASAEIEPFKQGYIELNFHPPLLFRDVTEFRNANATTAYGAKTQVPGDCHVVVAGSACVDYSSLNVNIKEFGEKGESYATMMGVMNYCEIHSPSVVILENIKGAPWQQICEKWYKDVGYDVVAVQIDTKNFYIPQTRTRGYMIGFNRKRAADAGFDTKKGLDSWVSFFGQLQQRSSSPYTEFIYANDSPENEKVRMMVDSTAAPSKKEISWALCRHRYMNFRSACHYGARRPYTNWQENGTSRTPDFSWYWLRVQRDRVLDTLDIALLRYIVDRDYDMSAKSRTVDLSQNIDRDLDSKHWGIVGCLTSTLLLYDTYRGGVVSGVEALILQGIPVDDLILSKLSMKHMIDLAGNAMTSTVVGSAMLAAVAAGTQGDRTIFFPAPTKNGTPDSKVLPELPLPDSGQCQSELMSAGLYEQTQNLAARQEKSLSELKDFACHTRQLCSCEGVTGRKDTDFLLCRSCGHTVCTKCGKNPIHDYCSLNTTVTERQEPLKFIDEIQRALPRSLKFSDLDGFEQLKAQLDTMAAFKDEQFQKGTAKLAVPTSKTFRGNGTFATALKDSDFSTRELAEQSIADLNVAYRDLIREALLEPYHFRGVKRDTKWKVEYSSPKGTLVLIFAPVTDLSTANTTSNFPAMDCFWQLTVACPQDVAQGSMLREKLLHPVARMCPTKTLLSGLWEFWKYDADLVTIATVQQSGDFFPALESKMGITHENFTSLEVSEKLIVSFNEVIDGLPKTCLFEHLRDCGTPNNLLYRSTKQISSPAHPKKRYVFLFLDPGHLQDAIYDSMVIAFSHDRLPRTDTRLTLVKFATGWRPLRDLGEGKQGLFRSKVRCHITGQWLPCESTSLGPTSNEGNVVVWEPRHPDDKFLPVVEKCSDASVLVYGIQLPFVPELISSFGREAKRLTIDLADKRGKLKPLRFILGCLEVPDALFHEHSIPNIQSLLKVCETCAPSSPALAWKWVRQRKSQQLALRPMDDPEKSRDYEKALKSRPSIATAELYVTAEGAYLYLSINPLTLLHRVVAPILRAGVDVSVLEASWKVIEFNDLKAAIPYNIPFLSGNENSKPLQGPEEFSRKLWDSQKKTLSWMVQIEQDCPTFEEKTIQEHPIQRLEWNLVAQASRQTTVHGGILADGVGTGKTTVILALVGKGRVSKTKRAKSSTITRKGSEATLVLVPANLVAQWVEQIVHCYSQSFFEKHVVVIEDFGKLYEIDTSKIAQAKIVLVSIRLFEDVNYWESLCDMCYAPNVPTTSGRAQIQWLYAAMDSLDDLCEASNQFQDEQGLSECRKHLHEQLAQKEFANLSGFRKRDMQNIDPDKQDTRTVQLSEDANHQQAYPEAIGDPELFDNDWNEQDKPAPRTSQGGLLPLLHMFSFNRMVVDEFQYLSPKVYAAVSTLRSEKTWLLSGTPPIDDVDSVDAMARLLGTRITMRPDEFVCQGFAPEKAAAFLKQRSYVEEFQAFNDVDSVAVLDNRREQARTFLTRFAKSNTVTTADLRVIFHIVPFKPQAVERAVHTQYYVTLNNEAIKYSDKDVIFKQLDEIRMGLGKKPKPGSTKPDTADAIIHAIAQCRNAPMAMLSCYAMSALKLSDGQDSLSLETLFQQLAKEQKYYFTELNQRLIEATGYWFEGEGVETLHKESGDLTNWVTQMLRDGRLGDRDLTLAVDYMLGYAQNHHAGPEELLINILKKSKTWVDRKDVTVKVRNKEMQLRCSGLRDIVLKTIKTMRQMRLVHTLRSIDSDAEIVCTVCGRSSGGSPAPRYEEFKLQATCGHVFCKNCGEEGESKKDWDRTCHASGCELPKESPNVYEAASFAGDRAASSSNVGSRATAIIDQINKILGGNARKARDSDDYVAIFVQYPAQARELAYAFEKEGIPLANACVDPGLPTAATMKNALAAARQTILNFKIDAMKGNKALGKGFFADLKAGDTSAKKAKNPHVLMAMVNSEDAAGWNLQVVNHVVFAAPLVATSQFRYESTIKQAIGRALRVGQQKVVHVYQYAMAYTTEVNILEDRDEDGRVIGKVDDGYAWVEVSEVAEEDRVSGPPLLVGSEEDEAVEEGEGGEGELA